MKICESSSWRVPLGISSDASSALSQRRSRLVPRRAHEHGRLVHVQPRMSTLFKHLSRPGECATPVAGPPRPPPPDARSRPRASRARQRRRQLSQSKKRTCINVFFTRYRPFIHERRVRPSRRASAPRARPRAVDPNHSSLSHDSSNPPTSSTRRTGFHTANLRLGGSLGVTRARVDTRAFARRRR